MKKMICLCLAAALCAAVLAGCAAKPPAAEDEIRLWYTENLSPWSARAAALRDCAYEGEKTVPAVLGALLAGPPEESGLTSPFPRGTSLLDWSLESGILLVDLSRAYGDLVGVDLTLADYCITLTMTQLEGVEGVRVTVNGGELPYRDRQVFYAEDVILSGVEEEPVELSAALYFRRADSGQLGYELRIFRLTESDQPALAVLEALLAGPEDEGLIALFPQGIEVRSVRMDDGICYADFSAALLETVPWDPAEQQLVLTALVETLCGLENVRAVQVLVEGETVTRYGQQNISAPLEPASADQN